MVRVTTIVEIAGSTGHEAFELKAYEIMGFGAGRGVFWVCLQCSGGMMTRM